MSLPVQLRALEPIDFKSVDQDKRTARLSFSSDVPYLRGFGYEILSHTEGAMMTHRLDSKAVPFLLDHDWSKQIGKITSYDLVGGKAYANIKLSRNNSAKEAMNDMADGIRTEVSVGYIIHEMEKQEETRKSESGEDEPEFLVTKWEPLEVSLVSVPADWSVGVGRSADHNETFEAIVASGDTQSTDPKKPNNAEEDDKEELEEVEEDLGPEANVENLSAEKPTVETRAVSAGPQVIIDNTPISMPDTAPTVDVIKETREGEVTRIREITALGVKFDLKSEADLFINEGKSADAFRQYVIEKKMSTTEPSVRLSRDTQVADIKDHKQYNICKAIMESAYNDRKVTGFEYECSREIEKKTGTPPTGFYVPDFVFSQRSDLAALTNNLGGYTIQTSVEPYLIPLLRNKMVVGKAGATMMGGLVGNVEIPRQITAATATWNSEVADPTRTNQTFDQVPLNPQRLSAVTAFSKQLLAQSQLDVQMIVRDDLLKIVAIAQDLAALSGSGASNQPTGILSTTADTVFPSAYAKTSPSVTFSSSGYPTWTNVVAFEGNVETNNVDLDDPSCSYIVSPSVKALWKTLAKFDPRATNQFYPEFLLMTDGISTDGRSGTINGYKAFATQQLSSNKVIFGKFSDLIIGTWGGLDLITDPYTLASSFQVRIIVNLLTTIAIRYGPAFCYSTNTGLQNGV